MPFLPPNQQRQSTEGNVVSLVVVCFPDCQFFLFFTHVLVFILLFLSLLCHCFKVMICMYVCYMLFNEYSNTQMDPLRFLPPSNYHRRGGHIVSPPPGRYVVSTVAQQLTEFRLTQRVARSLCGRQQGCLYRERRCAEHHDKWHSNFFLKLHSAFWWFQTVTVSECCSIKLLPLKNILIF